MRRARLHAHARGARCLAVRVCGRAVGAGGDFLNAPGPATEEYPVFAGKPIGGTLTLFIEVVAIEKVYGELKTKVKVTMPLEKKWYGVTEFAFEDPDGYVITFAERTP